MSEAAATGAAVEAPVYYEDRIDVPVIEISDRSVRDLGTQDYDRDPRIVRWGYNPALRGVHLATTKTGLPVMLIPIGEFMPFTTFQTPAEVFTLDEYKPKEELRDVLAHDAELEVRTALERMGYQSLLFGVTDKAVVTVINETVLPTLPKIRALFGGEMPIAFECPASDEYDFGEPRVHCATCHLIWIRSDACRVNMEAVAESGLEVRAPRADGKLYQYKVKPTMEQLEEARAAAQRGLETYIRAAHEQWAAIVSELDNKKRLVLNDNEQFLRKDIHELKPQHKEFGMVREMVNATEEMRRKEGAGASVVADNGEVLAVLVDSLAEQRKFNEMMAGYILKKGHGEDVDVVAKTNLNQEE